MSFPELREILQLEPSKQTWEKLTQLFNCWEGGDLELAVEYAIEHTKSWDPKKKYLYSNDRKSVPRWIQLVANLRHYTSKPELSNWLKNLTNLMYLDLWDCDSLENVNGLERLTNLQWLDLSYCYSLKNVDGVKRLANLAYLDLRSCKSLEIQPCKPCMTTREEVAEYQETLKKGNKQ